VRQAQARVARTLAAVALLSGVACIDLTVDPDAVGSIEFPLLPSPSVISGDTLRDATGAPYPLTAIVYAANGDVLTDRPVTFLSTDTLTHIGNGGIVIGDTLTFGTTDFVSRLVASVDGLQSFVRNLAVVPRPDTVVRQGAETDTILYSLPALASDTSMQLSVRLSSYRASDTIAVSSYVVTYRLMTFAGVSVPSTDTTRAFFMVNDAGRITTIDTTAGGVASRRLRFRINQGQAAVDSIQVLAEVRRGRQFVPGSPVIWRVWVQRKQ
jgi:hypothetical protein